MARRMASRSVADWACRPRFDNVTRPGSSTKVFEALGDIFIFTNQAGVFACVMARLGLCVGADLQPLWFELAVRVVGVEGDILFGFRGCSVCLVFFGQGGRDVPSSRESRSPKGCGSVREFRSDWDRIWRLCRGCDLVLSRCLRGKSCSLTDLWAWWGWSFEVLASSLYCMLVARVSRLAGDLASLSSFYPMSLLRVLGLACLVLSAVFPPQSTRVRSHSVSVHRHLD